MSTVVDPVHNLASLVTLVPSLVVFASLTDSTRYQVRAVIIALLLIAAVVLAWFLLRPTMFGVDPVEYRPTSSPAGAGIAGVSHDRLL